MKNPQTSVVLVHGAFADATGWQGVIPLLEKEGLAVTGVQNPMKSLEDDIATTRRVIDAQKGPVVVVGHSYGGAVISGAAAGRTQVKALVYVAAFAPDAGDTLGGLLAKFPTSLIGPALRPDSAGFLSIDREQFKEVFAKDVEPVTLSVMAATQKPIHSAIFDQTIAVAAWRTIPSWYVVASEDHAIPPELERFFALRMSAHTTEIKSSHVPYVSQPAKVAAVILEAVRAVAQ